MGTSAPVTRPTGASSQSNACSCTSAAMLAPTPPCGHPSSTTTQRFVFCTERRIVSRSSGRSVRGSITLAPRARVAGAGPELPVLRRLAALAVEVLVLDEDHRVVVADRRLQEPLGVG